VLCGPPVASIRAALVAALMRAPTRGAPTVAVSRISFDYNKKRPGKPGRYELSN